MMVFWMMLLMMACQPEVEDYNHSIALPLQPSAKAIGSLIFEDAEQLRIHLVNDQSEGLEAIGVKLKSHF